MKKPKRIDTKLAAKFVAEFFDPGQLIAYFYPEEDGLRLRVLLLKAPYKSEVILDIPFDWIYNKSKSHKKVTKRLQKKGKRKL